jgi:chromosome segregation ATPase
MPSFEFDGHKLEKKKRRFEPIWPNFEQNAFNQKPTAFASNNDCSKCAIANENEEKLREIIKSLKNQLENSEKAQEEANMKAVKLAMQLDKANAELSHKSDLIKTMEIKMSNLLETTKGRSTAQMVPSGPLLLKDVEAIDKLEAVHQQCLKAKQLAETKLAESVGKINVCERALSKANGDLATVNREMDKAKGEFAKVNGELINAKMELNQAIEKLEKMANVPAELAKSKGDLAAVAKVHQELSTAKRDLAKATEELIKANVDMEKLSKVQEELGKSRKRINELNKLLEQKYTKNKGLEELAETKAKLYEIVAEKDDLTEQLKVHKIQLDEMAKLAEKSTGENGELGKELVECKELTNGINGNGINGNNELGKEIQENQIKLKEIQV